MCLSLLLVESILDGRQALRISNITRANANSAIGYNHQENNLLGSGCPYEEAHKLQRLESAKDR